MRKVLKQSLADLAAERTAIEREIKELQQELDTHGGLNAPLVDKEGFPRGDIDLFVVRQQRQRYRVLQNDHKALMSQIELQLKEYMELPPDTAINETPEIVKIQEEPQHINLKVLFDVREVMPESPAFDAGLKVGDEILSFGDMKFQLGKSERDIFSTLLSLLSSNVGERVDVVFLRDDEEKKIIVIPNTWNGNGLLGCFLVPRLN